MVTQALRGGNRALRRLLSCTKSRHLNVSRVLVAQGVRPFALECVLRSRLLASTTLQVDINTLANCAFQEELGEVEDDEGEPR